MAQLRIWSSSGEQWVNCPPDEITWLDRALLSGNTDLTLHRSPRCAGLRHVHHRWELFSRDPSHQVYLAPHTGAAPLDHRTVQLTARHVLPVAPAQHYETLPLPLEHGTWLVSVGAWVVALRLTATAGRGGGPDGQAGDEQPPTQEAKVRRDGAGEAAARRRPARPDAVSHVRSYFQRNGAARMALAYHYQEYILGLPAPQPVPMLDVVVALDLSGEGAISDYKKLLQGFIWEERGHPRELPEFLLANGLLTRADLADASRVVLANERSGRCELARQRLAYRPKKG